MIRLANTNDCKKIIEILNNTTLNLHKKGIKQWSYPWSKDGILKDIKKGYIYILKYDGEEIATFSIKDINYYVIEMDSYNKYLYRIAILPKYQGNNLGMEIIDYSITYAENLDKGLYLDCWAGNKKLKKFYLNAGFKYLGDFKEEDYMISVFKYSYGD
ncbi:MAG: GNAT family N-acetyltransferase [Firmicutes bacterium]|nr:GNAT family N-acetyltransferase [Bacillota bacterium]